jgi:hypothetical protein
MGAKKMRQPSVDLEEAVRIAKIVYDNGKEIDKDALAGTLGHGDAQKSEAKRKFATLNYFGLAYGEGDKILSTDICQRIFSPTQAGDDRKAKFEAFCNYGIYKGLYDKYPKNVPQQKALLVNVVEKDSGLASKSKKRFMEVLIESGKYAGVIEEIDQDQIKFIQREVNDVVDMPGAGEESAEEGPRDEGEQGGVGSQRRLTANFNIELNIDSDMTSEKLKEILEQLRESLPELFRPET